MSELLFIYLGITVAIACCGLICAVIEASLPSGSRKNARRAFYVAFAAEFWPLLFVYLLGKAVLFAFTPDIKGWLRSLLDIKKDE